MHGPAPGRRRPAAAVDRARRRRSDRASTTCSASRPCLSSPRSRPTPSASTREFAGTALERFTPLTFTALKTAVPAPDGAYGHELVVASAAGASTCCSTSASSPSSCTSCRAAGSSRTTKQSAKPRFGLARWRFADGRALLLTEAGHRAQGRACGWSTAIPRTQAPLAGLGPEADTVDAATLLTLLARAPDAAARVPPRPAHRRRARPAARQRDLPPGPAVAVRQHRQARRRRRRRGSSRPSSACIDEALAYERGRDDMSSSADRPAHVHHRDRRDLPRVRRRDPGGRVPPLHGRLLPHLPDRRQGPGRQHHLQVPRSSAVLTLGGAQIRPSSLTASRSSTSSATLVSMRARLKSSMSRPWTIS